MRKINLLLLMLVPVAQATEVSPLGDNVLFAFEKCQVLSVDLKKGGLTLHEALPFDVQCRNNGPLEFKCDYIDVKTNKRTLLEVFTGGKDKSFVSLVSKGGTQIKFVMGNQAAYYETTSSGTELIQGKKVCSGIFLMEKEGLKQKK